MNDVYQPANAPVTEDDFRNCGWRDALAGASGDGYFTMSRALATTAAKAADDGHERHAKVLRLLADACSLMLTPDSTNEPFKPIMVIDGKRSAIPDDFTEADICFFAAVADEIDEPWLKARLSDLAWLCGKPRDPRFALMAIDAYCSIPLAPQTWWRGGNECWPRAVRLADMLGKSGKSRLVSIVETVTKALLAATTHDGYFGLQLANLLQKNQLGRANRVVIAEKLESLADEFDNSNAPHQACKYFAGSAKWFHEAGDKAKAASMTACEAESYVKEAEARLESSDPSYMVAADFCENAIQVYRTISRSEREPLKVDERIAELSARVADYGERSLSEMHHISSPGIDISKLVEASRKEVSGKGAIEALRAFCGLQPYVDVAQERASAIEKMRKYPLSSMFSATVRSFDGRVVAKHPGVNNPECSPDENDPAVWADVVQNCGLLIGVTVQGSLFPALDVLWHEHRLHEADFVDLARHSPVVPKDRSQIFGKALFAGYDRNFMVALHLLVPQIENLVRHHLKEAGATTTNIDINGIENELGMSKLMALPDAETVFGPNLCFELKALFCDPFGPNLRNQLAHGLLDEGDVQSVYAVYAWWLGLKLVFIAFWNTAHGSKLTDPDTERRDDDDIPEASGN